MRARIEWRQVGVLAAKEWRERLRNRWVLAVALVFAFFALAIAYFGAAQQGQVGFHGIDATIASLSSLVIYLVPLIALILGYDAIVGERERGALELLLSMPVTPLEVLLGKYLGLAAALTSATAIGFGAGLLPLFSQLTVAEGWRYAQFVASAVLMGLAFLSIAMLVSVSTRDRVRASGIALALWFLFVLVFDLLLMGVMVLSQGQLGSGLFAAMLMLNPADVFRLLNVFSSDQAQAMYGLATVMPQGWTHPALLSGVMLAWIFLPFSIALRRFS
ncbi:MULTISPECIES: ABC transporter permease [Janthinobacterium]|uniref:Cu-processing system permease protein n=1 Tax=Janthinobacterium lividum TaxID=29581 RepID=A0A031GVY8_9BURK|nr:MULTISPECIES: ABC transporter permease subunit [Janthinobacterium]EZP40646.1 ABC-type transport system involved in multi-copper enzyme maturation, permease component [Janthinobacterium lividum]MBW3502063.1 ABC transporter permease [Janthinobacterium sp. NKUCC08_JDC]MDX8125167.1 ABC transporter permease subunit [Janthinobacterium sp. GMG2]OEZ76496.1 ABC-2 family transporter protein [Janthinobacterium sp. HH104]SFY26250.1 Cu-processing system permease protein [Janthinobacterium lividum]